MPNKANLHAARVALWRMVQFIVRESHRVHFKKGYSGSDITEQAFVRTLQQFLSSLASLGAHAVIVIDEAQRLEPDALEQVRLLCSLEAEWQALLQVIMVGRLPQPCDRATPESPRETSAPTPARTRRANRSPADGL